MNNLDIRTVEYINKSIKDDQPFKVSVLPHASDYITLKHLSDAGDPLAKGLFHSIYNKVQSMLGKVQVEKTITKEGTTFTEHYWKNPDEMKNAPKTKSIHEPLKPGESRHFSSRAEIDEYFGIRTPNSPKGEYLPVAPPDRRFNKGQPTWWFAKSPFMQWIMRLTKPERDAIQDYTYSKYTYAINFFLRRKPHPDDEEGVYYKDGVETVGGLVGNLDTAIEKSVLPEPMITYRQLRRYDKTKKDLLEDFLSPNGIYKDSGFVSTTPIQGSYFLDAESIINLRIKVPAGKGIGAWVAPISMISSENELLLRRDLDFKVLTDLSKIDRQSKEITIDLEVIPPTQPPEDFKAIQKDQENNGFVRNKNFNG